MQKLKIWIKAFRLRTLPLAFSSTFLGSFLASSRAQFSWSVFVFASLTTLFLQILSNLANDYGDYTKGTDNEARIGPERVTQTGQVKPHEIKRMIIVFVILSLISGLFLIYFGLRQLPFYLAILFFSVGLLAIYAAVKYTVGKNAYGYMGMGDLFVFIFFGLVGVCGTYFLHTGSLDISILLPASAIGFLSAGVLNLNNLRDVENDAQSGKRTLVVRMGVKAAKIYHLVLLGLSVVFACVYTLLFYTSPLQFLFLITLPIFIKRGFAVYKNEVAVELYPELTKLAIITFIFSITLGLGLIL